MPRLSAYLPTIALLFVGLPSRAADPAPPVVEVFRGTPEPGTTPAPMNVPVGRFIAFPSSVKDLTYDVSDPALVDQLSIAAGTPYPGVRFDEPAGAKIKHYKITDSTGKPAPAEVFLATAKGTVRVTVWQNGKGPTGGPGKVAEYILNLTGGLPPPDPIPPAPVPPAPIPPPPPVVKTFRVIFGYETGTPLTAAQTSVIMGKAVEEYLKRKTTPEGGIAGFRRYDKDTVATNDQPNMKALWEAVQASIKATQTGIPFMAVEVNGKAEILPLDPNPAAALATLKKYGGD